MTHEDRANILSRAKIAGFITHSQGHELKFIPAAQDFCGPVFCTGEVPVQPIHQADFLILLTRRSLAFQFFDKHCDFGCLGQYFLYRSFQGIPPILRLTLVVGKLQEILFPLGARLFRNVKRKQHFKAVIRQPVVVIRGFHG
jgi:hypothetical protein